MCLLCANTCSNLVVQKNENFGTFPISLYKVIFVRKPFLSVLEPFEHFRKKKTGLLNTNKNLPKSNLVYFFWRLSRLLSVSVLLIEIILIYSLYFDIFQLPFKESIREEIYNSFVIILPVAILILYNFLIFGKVTIWLKKP